MLNFFFNISRQLKNAAVTFTIAVLDAYKHLYKRVCPSVRPSVGPSVRRFVMPIQKCIPGASYG